MEVEPCPCGSGQSYADCCQPYIKGDKDAPTAEALMRSRYSAHVKAEIDYICRTVHESQRKNCNPKEIASWCRKSDWQSLEIIETQQGGPDDQTGTVEFAARYRQKEKLVNHHEIAEFKKEDGRWTFVDGKPAKMQTVVRGPKTGRNEPCPCGSGKKFKKCCGA